MANSEYVGVESILELFKSISMSSGAMCCKRCLYQSIF